MPNLRSRIDKLEKATPITLGMPCGVLVCRDPGQLERVQAQDSVSSTSSKRKRGCLVVPGVSRDADSWMKLVQHQDHLLKQMRADGSLATF